MQNVSATPSSSGLLHKIAVFFDVEYFGDEIQSFILKRMPDFLPRPKVKLPLLSFAISIFSRIEPAFWRCHIPQNIGENLPRRLCIVFFSCCLIGLGVRPSH